MRIRRRVRRRRVGPGALDRRGLVLRSGTTLVETLLAVVLVLGLVAGVGGALWSFARNRNLLEQREACLSLASARLELVTSLPLERRPLPGSYAAGDAGDDEDLARVLASARVGAAELSVSLTVEEHPVHYPDYFFGSGETIPYLDLRRYRVRVRGAGAPVELVAVR